MIWWLLLFSNSADAEASSREIETGAVWFVLGAVSLLVSALSVFSEVFRGLLGGDLGNILTVCLLVYIFVGIAFFFSGRTTNNTIPWQDNGAW